MSDTTETSGTDSTQSQTDVAENLTDKIKMEEFDAGGFVDSKTPEAEATGGGFVEDEKDKDDSSGVEKTEDQVLDNKVLKDRAGTVFNPELHCTNEDGLPSKTKTGYFRKRKGAKEKALNVEVVNNFNSPAKPSTLQMVGFILDASTLLTVKFMGPEWKPSPEEKAMLTDVWARFCEYKGWDLDGSPEFVVTVATATFLMPRLMMSPFIQNLFKKRSKNAHPDNRTAGTGQDNVGTTHSAGEQSTGGDSGPHSNTKGASVKFMG